MASSAVKLKSIILKKHKRTRTKLQVTAKGQQKKRTRENINCNKFVSYCNRNLKSQVRLHTNDSYVYRIKQLSNKKKKKSGKKKTIHKSVPFSNTIEKLTQRKSNICTEKQRSVSYEGINQTKCTCMYSKNYEK